MSGFRIASHEDEPIPRVVVIGLASCFGCQLQITNAEQHLLDILGQIDLNYWQLTSSSPLPEAYDLAIIEGAVTTEEACDTVRNVRKNARCLIAIGACATTGGIPALAAAHFSERASEVYGQVPKACGKLIAPRPVSQVVDVDFEVRTCPIDAFDFIDVLQRALYGSNKAFPTRTMCGDCKRNESNCFFGDQTLCLGLITRAGCGARCVNLGRPCNGCRGLSPDANLNSAREACQRYGVDVNEFNRALKMFNEVNPQLDQQ